MSDTDADAVLDICQSDWVAVKELKISNHHGYVCVYVYSNTYGSPIV